MPTPVTTGIIVGLNATLEYLLPFFYLNLRLHSQLPIVFFDFGMSIMGRAFCEKRGQVIAIEESLYQPDPLSAKSLKRAAWFKKPLACKKAPFDVNLWLDLDCLVKGPLEEIFTLLSEDKWIVIMQEYTIDVTNTEVALDPIPMYNSGVFAFRKNSPFIDLWINLSQKSNLEGIGDQDMLSFELLHYKEKLVPLSSQFNLMLALEQNPNLEDPFNEGPLEIVSSPLYALKPLIDSSCPIETAHLLHFTANLKSLLLARYQALELLMPMQGQQPYV